MRFLYFAEAMKPVEAVARYKLNVDPPAHSEWFDCPVDAIKRAPLNVDVATYKCALMIGAAGHAKLFYWYNESQKRVRCCSADPS
jgi:hypothetical protein